MKKSIVLGLLRSEMIHPISGTVDWLSNGPYTLIWNTAKTDVEQVTWKSGDSTKNMTIQVPKHTPIVSGFVMVCPWLDF